jgi:peptide deformylase
MSVLQLRTYPDPCLRVKTKPVEIFDQDLRDILKAMADMMYLNKGIGLAAPQVGLGIEVVVVDIGEGLINFVNPVILERSRKMSGMEEGCLSLPGVTVTVKRPEEVKVRAQDDRGEFFMKKFTGLAATAVQHEIDHLNGKLIIDHLDPVRHFIASRKLRMRNPVDTGKTCEVICHVGKRDN